jgi:tetratricopeptide (TPR) repeat protein
MASTRHVLVGAAILALAFPAFAEDLESPVWWVEQARQVAEAVAKDTGSQGGLRNVADTFALLGDCDRAEAAFALMPAKDKRSAHYSLIEAMVMGGHPDRARAFVKTATGATEAKLMQTYRAALARTHALAGEVDKARELMQTVESDMSRRQIWYALVDGQFRAGKHDQALDIASTAETPAMRGQLLGYLAGLQVDAGATEEARATIAKYGARGDAKHLTIARLRLLVGDLDAAVAAFGKMKDGRAKSQQAGSVGEALAKAGRFDDAVALATATGLKAGGRVILARTACEQGRAGKAEDAMKTLALCGLGPDSKYGHMDLAEGLALGGHVEQARKVLAALDRVEWRYKTWARAAEAAVKAGDTETACAMAAEAEKTRSDAAASPTAKTSFLSIYDMTLARVWAALGKADEAEAAFARIEDKRWVRSTPRWMALDALEHGHLAVAHRISKLLEAGSRVALMCHVAEVLRAKAASRAGR